MIIPKSKYSFYLTFCCYFFTSSVMFGQIKLIKQKEISDHIIEYTLEMCCENNFDGYLFTGNTLKSKIWKNGKLIGANGFMVSSNDRSYGWDYAYLPIHVDKEESQIFRLQLYNHSSLQDLPNFSLLKNVNEDIAIKMWKYFPRIVFSVGTLLVIIFFFLFSLGRFWQIREMSFLYYSGYLGTILITLLMLMEYSPYVNIFFSYHHDYLAVGRVLFSVLPALFYIQFHRYFLDLPTVYPRGYRNAKIIFSILLVGMLLYYIVYFSWGNNIVLEYLQNILFFIEVFFGFLFFADVYIRIRSVLVIYACAGSTLLIIGGGTFVFLNQPIDIASIELWSWARLFLQIGVLLEILFFSLGLGCKLQQKQEAIVSAQLKEITQLKEKQRLEEQLKETKAAKVGLELQHSDLLDSLSTINMTQQQNLFIERINSVLMKHIKDETFSVKELAFHLGLSRIHLHRKIKSLLDQTPSEYIKKYRLHQSLELLQTTDLNISEIAYNVGFKDPGYFSKVFFKSFGLLPSDIKRPISD